MIVDWLVRRAKRTPYIYLAGYMERDWLVPYVERGTWGDEGCGPVSWRRPIAKLLQKLGIAVRIHTILRSDNGREPHDHKWPYVSVILRGYYYEERFDDNGERIADQRYGPGSIIYRPAGTWHLLTLPDPPVTTLFITGRPKLEEWGFNVDGVKVPAKEYTKRDS